jgi:hypothetical protein
LSSAGALINKIRLFLRYTKQQYGLTIGADFVMAFRADVTGKLPLLHTPMTGKAGWFAFWLTGRRHLLKDNRTLSS